jgi:hypothetical protein
MAISHLNGERGTAIVAFFPFFPTANVRLPLVLHTVVIVEAAAATSSAAVAAWHAHGDDDYGDDEG